MSTKNEHSCRKTEPESGTPIMLDLPVSARSAQALSATEQERSVLVAAESFAGSVEDVRGQGTLVLLVDDQPIIRMVMRRQLQVLGYACETAEDGEQALVLWSSGRFALLLTDCNMPLMSGYELSRRIRQKEAVDGQRRAPIIACSANALSGDVEHCIDAGMDDYLPKPTDLLVLAEKMEQWLPLRRADTSPPWQASVASTDPVDPSTLHLLTQGEPTAVRRVLAHFRRVNQTDVSALRSALEQVDLTGVTHAAHRIKGASGLIGAGALASVCQRIEDAARAGELHAASPLRGQLDHELERLNAYLIAQQA